MGKLLKGRKISPLLLIGALVFLCICVVLAMLLLRGSGARETDDLFGMGGGGDAIIELSVAHGVLGLSPGQGFAEKVSKPGFFNIQLCQAKIEFWKIGFIP